VASEPKRGSFAHAAGTILLLQAIGLVAATFVLAGIWAVSGWTVERGQALGLIWFGVMAVLWFLAWVTIHLEQQPEEPTVLALHERRLS
jgi:hypothetical protein